MRIIPYRASHFEDGYVAEFLPTGQATWRLLKSGGEPIVFKTNSAARQAAEQEYLRRLEPTIRASLPVDPDKAEAKMEAKMLAQAEQWLQTKREDAKNVSTMHRPGKKPVIVMPGRARA